VCCGAQGWAWATWADYSGGVSPHQFDEDLKIVLWRDGGAGYGKSIISGIWIDLKIYGQPRIGIGLGLVSVALGAARARGGVCQVRRGGQ
jgi:hypothetical protein